VEGIFLLDDIPGMISRRSYLEFAHPYLKRICEAFPADWVKVYHNDANVRPFLSDLATVGFDRAELDPPDRRWRRPEGHRRPVVPDGQRRAAGSSVRGTPAQVEQAARQVIERASGGRLILSFGGGLSPGTRRRTSWPWSSRGHVAPAVLSPLSSPAGLFQLSLKDDPQRLPDTPLVVSCGFMYRP